MGSAAAIFVLPLAVAFAESVIERVALFTVRMVVPYGIPLPVIVSPGTSAVIGLTAVTELDPLVSVPLNTIA